MSVDLKVWFEETRPQFLLLSVVLALLGGAMAAYYGPFKLSYVLLAGLGVLLLHVSVNVFNDYEDYRSGLDASTHRTPFSGGSGILPAGRMSRAQVLALALGAFASAAVIGGYFLWKRGPLLIPLLVFGVVAVFLYTRGFLRIGWGVGEVVAGLGLGSLPVLGICFVGQGFYDPRALFASVPSGFLVFNLLLLNEFPDAEADSGVGRRTLPVQAGMRFSAAVYGVAALSVYVWIAIGLFLNILPPWTALAFLTLPVEFTAIRGAWRWRAEAPDLKSMAANVTVVLLTQFLFAAGFLISCSIGR